MDVHDAIYSRKSVRDFQRKAIDEQTIKKIIGAGLHAPSHDHMREWEFLVIRDREVRAKVIDKVQKHHTKKEIEAWLDSWNSRDPL